MALSNLGLGFVFSARDHASPVIRGIRHALINLSNTATRTSLEFVKGLRNMSLALQGLKISTVAVGAAIELADFGGRYEQQLARVGMLSQATSQELQQLDRKAIQSAMGSQFSPHETIDALEMITTRGYAASESIQMLDATLDLAAAGQIPIQEASGITSQALKTFSLRADQAREVTDQLMKVTTLTSLRTDMFETALANVSRTAGTSKLPLNQVVTAMGLAANTMTDASKVGTGVASAMDFAAKNADKLKKLGVEVADANGNFRDLLEISLDVQNVMDAKGWGSVEQMQALHEVFGRFGKSAVASIGQQLTAGITDKTTMKVYKGAEAIEYLRAQMADAAGTTEAFKRAALETWTGQRTLLRGVLETIGVEVGRTLGKVLRPFVEFLLGAARVALDFWHNLPGPVREAAAAFVVFAGAVGFVTSAFYSMRTAARLLGVTLGKTMLFILPIVAIAAGLAIAFVALRRAYETNFGGFADFVDRVWFRIKTVFGSLWALFTDGVIEGDLAAALAENPVLFGIVDGISRFVFKIEKAFEQFDGAVNGLGSILTSVTSVYWDYYTGVFEGFVGAIDLLGPSVTGLGEDFVAAFGEVGAIISDIVTDLAEMFGITADGTNVWKVFGQVVGVVMTSFFTPMLWMVKGFLMAFRGFLFLVRFAAKVLFGTLKALFKLVTGDWKGALDAFVEPWKWAFDTVKSWFEGFIDDIKAMIQRMFESIAQVAKYIPKDQRPEWLNEFVEEHGGIRKRGVGSVATTMTDGVRTQLAGIAPTLAASENASVDAIRDLAKILKKSQKEHKRQRGAKQSSEPAPVQVEVLIDGARVAEAVARAKQSARALGFGFLTGAED